jgi:hypothetical protein
MQALREVRKRRDNGLTRNALEKSHNGIQEAKELICSGAIIPITGAVGKVAL